MNHAVSLVAGITVKEGLRNRAMQGIFAIALLLCVVYMTIVPLFAFDSGKVVVDIGFSFINISGLAIVIFLGIALLTKDIHQRTVCMILARPISRTDYVVGKFCGLAVTVMLAVLVIAVLTVAATWIGIQLFDEMNPPRNFSWVTLGVSIGFQYLALLILMAVAFFFACLTTSEYLSMLFTIGIYIIGNSLETIIEVIRNSQQVMIGPAYLKMLNTLAWFLPNLNAFDLQVYLAYGLPLPKLQALWTALYGLLYIGILAVATLWIFRRKEIT